MADPTKFVGPVYSEEDAKRLAADKGWTVKQDGDVAQSGSLSGPPSGSSRFARSNSARLRNRGGLHRRRRHPTMYLPEEQELEAVGLQPPPSPRGRQAVIDKDRSSAVLAQDQTDLLVIATDTGRRVPRLGNTGPEGHRASVTGCGSGVRLPAGSMGPKVGPPPTSPGNPGSAAVISALEDLPEIMAGTKGTRRPTPPR